MAIDRVATNAQAQYLISQITKANNALDTTQAQVSSGKVSSTYTGIGDKTANLEAARTAAARSDAYAANTQLAATQADLQDTQLTQLSSLAQQLQQAVVSATGDSDGTNLMTTAQSVFDQASSILNSKDANGNYIYSGGQGDTKPFTATSLSDLASGSVSSFFQNGSKKTTVATADGQSVQLGVLASDIGTQLMTALKNLATADSPSGSLEGSLSGDQVTTLTNNVLTVTKQAFSDINGATAANGTTYKSLQDAVTNQQSLSSLYKGFVSNIEDADMTAAVAKLNQDQTALQAALEMTSKLGQLSLLNYLPASTSSG